MSRSLKLDWDAVAGIVAAVIVLVMHLLHIVEADVLLTLAVVLMAMLFLRDLRRERQADRMEDMIQRSEAATNELRAAVAPADAVLVGPRRLRVVTEQFSAAARGEMLWFHVCLLMFAPQSLFDSLLRPALENPKVTGIQFILDAEQQQLWQQHVVPKVAACRGREKVREPRWTTIRENVSLIISDVNELNRTECLLSFWGEPFMARTVGRDVPRYIFHVQSHSELIGRLLDLVRSYGIRSS
jgi:hypothetical protein